MVSTQGEEMNNAVSYVKRHAVYDGVLDGTEV